MAKDDGGLSFPAVGPDGAFYSGMTMRQWYKAAALTGILTNFAGRAWEPTDYAQLAGELADALIAEDHE